MSLDDIKIKSVLVDYDNRKIEVNGGAIGLKLFGGNIEKIMLMAWLVAQTTKYPPLSDAIRGFTWSYIENRLEGHLSKLSISSKQSFEKLWYQGCLDPDKWSCEMDDQSAIEDWHKMGGDFLKKIFLSEALGDSRNLVKAPKNSHRMHLPDESEILIVPDVHRLEDFVEELSHERGQAPHECASRSMRRSGTLPNSKDGVDGAMEERFPELSGVSSDGTSGLSEVRGKDLGRGLYGKRSYDVRLRELYFDDIMTRIEGAEREIVFVGGISQSLLNPRTYQVIADRLQSNKKLTLSVYYESDDNLYRRTQYCERPLRNENTRDFEGAIRRKEEIERLPGEISSRVDRTEQDSVKKRIFVRQLHLQLYLVVTQIDSVMYVTPMSHRRNSLSVAFRCDDAEDPLYAMAAGYVQYLRASEGGAPYCTSPSDEIVQIVDARGIPRGYCGRTTLDYIPLRCKVVFGFVFNKEGEFLIQKRGQEASDNRDLWDKSFGGHMRGFCDSSAVETAGREFAEELQCKCDQVFKLAYLGNWQVYERVDCSFDRCLLFKLYGDPRYSSSRISITGDRRKLEFNVSAFAVFCPLSDQISFCPGVVSAIRWTSISELKRDINRCPEKYTPDLQAIMSSDKCKLLEDIARAISSSRNV